MQAKYPIITYNYFLMLHSRLHKICLDDILEVPEQIY